MKAIIFPRTAGQAMAPTPTVELVPDSALTLSGFPVFLPGEADQWELRVLPAFRISRLGKGITAKFASRYVDAVTVGVQVVPTTLVKNMAAEGSRSAISEMFDGALTLGPWVELKELPEALTVGLDSATESITAADINISGAIEAVSRYVTLKTGDVIAPVMMSRTFPTCVGSVVDATLSIDSVHEAKLHLKIK